MTRRAIIIVAVLIAIWAAVLGWQAVEHARVRESARVALINRAKDISDTLGIVLRSQRRFWGVPRERLESTLKELIKPGELDAIALLNAAGSIVASYPTNVDLDIKSLSAGGARWSADRVILMNLVDLGANPNHEPDENRPTIVLTPEDRPRPREGQQRPPPPPPDEFMPPPGTNAESEGRGPGRSGPRRGRWPFGRPFWMNELEFQALIEKQGVHSFILVMSAGPVHAVTRQDLWLRLLISGLASISVLAAGIAWRNLTKTSELELRLVRASEMNSHLREMNLAAAGLAHETRNPLNIIRGLAQLVCREKDASAPIRMKSREIIDETDRVTAQLNEFINYSRPREVRPANISLSQVIGEVARALACDLEEKCVRLRVPEGLPNIQADEQLFRQAIFNLLLNAVQAADRGGDIEVACIRKNGGGALEIRDNGPGVPAEQRAEIFKPYFTTHQKGTGLGLAVVQQIVLAHGWEIECLPNEPRGAIFRISHLKFAQGA